MCRQFDSGPRHRVSFLANSRIRCARADLRERVTKCRLVEVVVSLWRDREALRRGSCIRRSVFISRARPSNSSDATRASIAARRDALTFDPWAAGKAETRLPYECGGYMTRSGQVAELVAKKTA